jgi:hypothetical protein
MAPKSNEVKAYDMLIGIRRHRGGSFAGLYEVVELDSKMDVLRVITDANSKSMALGLMANAAAKV